MDLLFKRYANPFVLLDGYISTGRFCEFIGTFAEQHREDTQWEFFLHKVFDKTYAEYKHALQTTQELQSMTDADMEATIKKSMDILGSFHPNDKEGE